MSIYVDFHVLQTVPPSHVPQPIPKLKIPENRDIATAEASSGTALMVSAWKATLNAVTAIPQSTQTRITRYKLIDATRKQSKATATLAMMNRMNAYRCLSYSRENKKLPNRPAAPNSVNTMVIQLSARCATCFRNGSI